MIRTFLLMVMLTVAVGAVPAHAASANSADTAFVRDLGNEAIELLSRKDVGLATREKKFEGILMTRFDVPVLARFALGRHWRQASAEQKKDYIELFGRYVARSYAVKLGGYSGEKFRVVSEKPLTNKVDVLVNTLIERSSGPEINVTWRVRHRKETRRIVDVMVEGISMAVTQRDEFSSVVRQNGLQGLLDTLRARMSKMTAGK
jgi:phospholipid transport system substrate-binding protein